MLKKIIAGILAATMAISLPVVSFGADTIEIDCELSNDNVQVGEEFYADFKITDNPTGYNSMQCYVNFDSSKLEALECEVDDIPNDLIIYTDNSNVNYSIFSFTNVNGRMNFVPKSGDSDYLGLADGRSSAAKIGRIKLANLLNDSIDGVRVNYTGTGTLLRMKFRAIESGTSEISMTEVIGGYTNGSDGLSYDLAFNVNNGSVTISGGGSSEGETETTTTETTTTESSETTTSANSGGSSGGSGGSSGSTSVTTTEATTETTSSTTNTDSNDNISTDNNTDVSFSDVAEDFWGYEYIINLASNGVVNGYPNGTFRPNDNVKRADFLIMLLRGLDINTDEVSYEENFTDVDNNAYYGKACGVAKAMGIASGNLDGSFSPESYITRQDMMILAKKALELKTGEVMTGNVSVLEQFNDKAEISSYALDSLAAMVDAGVVSGMGEGIAPKANTTRAQAAVIIYKLMEII